MDKVKIKTAVTEVKELTDELVSEGKLDGDSAKQFIFSFYADEVRRERAAELTEV